MALLAVFCTASVAHAESAILAIGSTCVGLNIDGKRAVLKINESTDDGIKLLAFENGQRFNAYDWAKKVSVGSITLRNIDAGVLMGNFPVEPLSGASFLNRLDMRRDGRKMELREN